MYFINNVPINISSVWECHSRSFWSLILQELSNRSQWRRISKRLSMSLLSWICEIQDGIVSTKRFTWFNRILREMPKKNILVCRVFRFIKTVIPLIGSSHWRRPNSAEYRLAAFTMTKQMFYCLSLTS